MIIKRNTSSYSKTFTCLFVLLPITGCVDHVGGQKVEYTPTVQGYSQDVQQRDWNQQQKQFGNQQNGVPIYYGDNDSDYQRYNYDNQPPRVVHNAPPVRQIPAPVVSGNNQPSVYYQGDADSNYRPYIPPSTATIPNYYASPEVLNDTIPSSSGDPYSGEPGQGDNDAAYYPNYYDMY